MNKIIFIVIITILSLIHSLHATTTYIPDPSPTVYLNSLTTTLITASPGEEFFLQGCEYQVNSSQIWSENDGATYGFPMSYLAINQSDVTVVGNNSCPGGTTIIRFYHDQFVSPDNSSVITYMPAGTRVMNNGTWFNYITFEYAIDTMVVSPINTTSKFEYFLFISETLCPYEPFGDCQMREFVTESPEDWFPTYDAQDVDFNTVIVNFTLTNSRLTENCFINHDFLVIGPIDICGFHINNNYFENVYTNYPFFYNADNPNILICGGEPDPFPLDAPHMDLRYNCFDHTEVSWCADCVYYYYYYCNELGSNAFLNPNDPVGPPLLTWLPYSDCECFSRPSPLFTYHEGSGEQVGFLTFEDYLAYDIELYPTLYLGGGYYTVDNTIFVYNKTLSIGGSGGYTSCGCDIGIIVSEDVNPAFLSVDNNLCFTDTAVHMESNTTLAWYRGADAVTTGQSVVYTRIVGVDPDPLLTQVYTSVPTQCFWMMLDSHVMLADEHVDARGIIATEGGEEYLQHLLAFNTFQGLELSVYSGYGSLVIHNNLFTNLNLTQETNSTGVVIGHQGIRNFVSQNVFSGLTYGVVMNGGHENEVECNIFLNDTFTDVIFPCDASTTLEEIAECSDFVCHYANAAQDWFMGSYNRDYFLDQFAQSNVSYDETSFYIDIQDAIGFACDTAGCETTPETVGVLNHLFMIIHDSVQLESWIYLVLDGQPTIHTLDDVIDALCLVLQTEGLIGDIPVVDPCTPNSSKKVKTRKSVVTILPDQKHHDISSKAYVIPECVSSVNNSVVNNYHYNGSLSSGSRIYYTDPNIATQNILDSTYGFDFTFTETLEDIADFKFFTPESANSYVHTFGFSTYTDSVTLNITNAQEGNETVTRFVHGSYIHDWQTECAPENSLPVLFSVFDNFTRTDFDNCTHCIITFEIESSVFVSELPQFECTDVSVITSVNPQLGQWLGLPTLYDCDDSDGLFHFSTNCTGSTAHYTIAPPPTTLYVLCEDGTPYPPGVPYYSSIQEAVDAAVNDSTIYLSDGTCCAENVVIAKTIHFTSYYPDCYASVTCCFDYYDYPYSNGLCDWMFAFIDGSEGSTVTNIHFYGGNNIEKDTTAILVNPSYEQISDHYNIPFNHNPLNDMTISNCGFSTTHNAIKTWGIYNSTIDTNQFGSLVLPCHLVTEESLHAEYEHKGVFGQKDRLKNMIPVRENIKSSMDNNAIFSNNLLSMMVAYASDGSKSSAFGKHLIGADVSFKNSINKMRSYNRMRESLGYDTHPFVSSHLSRLADINNTVPHVSTVVITPLTSEYNTPRVIDQRTIVNMAVSSAEDAKQSLIDRLRSASEKNKIDSLKQSKESKNRRHNNDIPYIPIRQQEIINNNNPTKTISSSPSDGTLTVKRWNRSGKLVSTPFSELPCIENAIIIDPSMPDEECACPKDINYDIDPLLLTMTISNNIFTGIHSAIVIVHSDENHYEPVFTPIKIYILSNVAGGITGAAYSVFGIASNADDDAVIINSNYAFDCCENAKGIAIHGSANISISAQVNILCPSTFWAQSSIIRQSFLYESNIDISRDGYQSKTEVNGFVGGDNTEVFENLLSGSSVFNTENTMSHKRKAEDFGNGHIYKNHVRDNVLLVQTSESVLKGFMPDSCASRFENIESSGNINLDFGESVYDYDPNCLWNYQGRMYCLDDVNLEQPAYIYFTHSRLPRQCGFCSCDTNLPALNISNSADFFPDSVCPPIESICGPVENPGDCGVSVLLTCGTGDIDGDLVLCNKGFQRGDQGYCVPCDSVESSAGTTSSSSNGDDDDDWIAYTIGAIVGLVVLVCGIACITCLFFDRIGKQKSLETAESNALNNMMMMGGGSPASMTPSSSKPSSSSKKNKTRNDASSSSHIIKYYSNIDDYIS